MIYIVKWLQPNINKWADLTFDEAHMLLRSNEPKRKHMSMLYHKTVIVNPRSESALRTVQGPTI